MAQPFTLTIDLDDTQLLQNLARIEKQLGQAGFERLQLTAGRAVGIEGEAQFAKYPLKKVGIQLPRYYTRFRKDGTSYKSKFKSMKQQAFIVLKGKQGLIPYRRTGQLGRSWQSQVVVSGNTTSIYINSTAPYAEFVIGQRQNHFLAALGWRNEVDILKKNEEYLTTQFEKQLQGYIDLIDKQTKSE